MIEYHLDLRHLHLPGSGEFEFDNLEAACNMAMGFALPGQPIRIHRNPEFTDLAATVWHDGGIDFSR